MADILINSSADIANANQICVRTSAGIPYIAVYNNAGYVDIYKGDGVTPTSFTAQDTGNHPTPDVGTNIYNISIGITSGGVIHIVYCDDVSFGGGDQAIRYTTFNTATDTYSGSIETIIEDVGAGQDYPSYGGTGIAIDSNGIPHIVFFGYVANMGSDYWTVYYNNRIGGAWNASSLELEGKTAQVQAERPTIVIDSDNKPVIVWIRPYDGLYRAAIGDANDASSFTISTLSSSGETSHLIEPCIDNPIAIDSDGDHIIAYITEDHVISVNKHVKADAWGTWQTEKTVTSSGHQNPALVVIGTDMYVIYSSTAYQYDILYKKWTGTWAGGSWGDAVTLVSNLEDDFDNVIARYSYLNNPSYFTYGIDCVYKIYTGPVYYFNIPVSSSFTPIIIMF